MAVPIIENWAKITGVIRSINTSRDIRGFVVVTVTVDKVEPVPDFPNLLADAVGQQLDILVPEELARRSGMHEGDIIVCRVRRAPLQRIFVHQQFLSIQPSTRAATQKQQDEGRPDTSEGCTGGGCGTPPSKSSENGQQTDNNAVS